MAWSIRCADKCVTEAIVIVDTFQDWEKTTPKLTP